MRPLTLVASICIALGIFFLGRKKRIGWIFQFMGSFLSIVHFSFLIFDLSVVTLNAALAGMAAWAWFHWREPKPESIIQMPRWEAVPDFESGQCWRTRWSAPGPDGNWWYSLRVFTNEVQAAESAESDNSYERMPWVRPGRIIEATLAKGKVK